MDAARAAKIARQNKAIAENNFFTKAQSCPRAALDSRQMASRFA
jgi:hypothetical protein